MSSEWRSVKLGDVVDLQVGPAFKSDVFRAATFGTRLLRGMNVGADGVRWAETFLWPDNELAGFQKYALQLDDVVIAMDATFTSEGRIRAGVVTASDLPALLVQRVARLRVRDKSEARQDFLWQQVRSEGFRDHLNGRQTGAFAPHISGGDIEGFQFVLPPLDVQRRIVDVLFHIDEHLDRLRDEAHCADQVWEHLLPLPDCAEHAPLGELLDSIDAGRSPSGEERRPEAHERAVLKVSAVARNRFCADEVKTVSAETALPPNSRISKRDVLMVRANGVLDRVGQVCLVDSDYENLYLCDKTLRLTPGEMIDQRYLAYALLAPHAREQIRSLTGGSQMRNIGQAAIRQIRIPVPQIDVQRQIAEVVEAAVLHARALDSEVSQLELIRAATLSRLLSGELEIPTSYDMLTGEAA